MAHNDSEQFSRLLARRLESITVERGMSQNQLSKLSGVSQSQISRIFALKRSVSMDQLSDIARVLGVSPSRVIMDVEEQMERAAKVVNLSELRSRLEGGQVEGIAALDPGYDPSLEDEPESP